VQHSFNALKKALIFVPFCLVLLTIIKIPCCICILKKSLISAPFMTCHPVLTKGHRYIIMVADYFMKWEKAM
jgi:hypothetical protein